MIWVLALGATALTIAVFVAFSKPNPNNVTKDEFDRVMALPPGERLYELHKLLHRGLRDKAIKELMANTAIEMIDEARNESERDREITQRIRMPRLPS